MNKKLIFALLGLILIAIVAFIFFFLNRSGNSNYRNAIPANAQLVAAVDIASIVDKSGLGDKKYIDKLKQELGGIVPEETLNQATSYIQQAEKTGIDFRQKIYVFTTPDQCVCLLAKVADKSMLNKLITDLAKDGTCDKPTEKDGTVWTKILGEMPAAFNDDALIAMMPTDGFNNPKVAIKEMLEQDQKNSFFATDKAKTFDKAKGDITFSASLAALPKNLLGTYSSLLPKGVRPSEVETTISLAFLDGKISLKQELSSQNDKLKALLEETNSNTKKIKGLYLDKSSDKSWFWASAGINGEWLLTQLKKADQFKQQLFLAERAIDIEKMIKSIDGDLMISLQLPNGMQLDNMPYLVAGKTKDQDFLKDVDYWTTSMREYGLTMTQSGDKQYKLVAEDMTFFWGTRPDDLYFTSSPELVQPTLNGPGSQKLKELKDEILNSKLYVFVDFQQMAQSGTPNEWMFKLIASMVDSYSLSLTEAEKMEITVRTPNKEENVLRTIIGGLAQSVRMLM